MKKSTLFLFLVLLKLSTLLAQEKQRTFTIMFDDFELSFKSNDIWSADSIFAKTYSDTVIIDLGLGERLDNHKFKISENVQIDDLRIFEQYQTSMSISDEGAHLDLVDWKHFLSKKQSIKIEDNKFKTDSVSEKESKYFPNVSIDEIKNQVFKVIGNTKNKFYRRALECNSSNDYPCYVSISRKILTFTYLDKEGKKKERVIIFNIPMGC